MPIHVILLVLFGALLHATWNAMIKAGTDKSLDASLISAGGAVCALPLLMFLPLPNSAAWSFIGASAILQFVYFQLVAGAYRAGDIGQPKDAVSQSDEKRNVHQKCLFVSRLFNYEALLTYARTYVNIYRIYIELSGGRGHVASNFTEV